MEYILLFLTIKGWEPMLWDHWCGVSSNYDIIIYVVVTHPMQCLDVVVSYAWTNTLPI